MPEVVVLGEGGGWHAGQLAQALRDRGAKVERLRFDQCRLEAGAVRLGLRETLPDAVVVRSIPGGTFEQVTLRLGLLHALREAGVLVVNDARAIERCVDKAATSFLLAKSGVPTPPAWAMECREAAARLLATEKDLVLKPLFGAQGKGLKRIRQVEDLPEADAVAGVWYLQRYVGRSERWQDYRVLVVAGRPIAAMARVGVSWITNIKQGASPEPVETSGELGDLAVAAAAAVGAFYAGVDLIETTPGSIEVLEVNSMPAWQGLQSVAPVDVAQELARGVLAALCRG
ncbi:MAG: RimK family alpha-L-glutamate ligase [Geminicoccaceae bacterium]